MFFKPSRASQSNQSPVNQPKKWFQGLWWSIWLTIIASVFIFALCTMLYFRLVIAVRIEEQEQTIQMEREQHRRGFHHSMMQQRESYNRQLEQWRYNTPQGTPVPAFEMPEAVRSFRRNANSHTNANPVNPILLLIIMVIVIGGATYPVARRLTRKLEKLQLSVEQFGTGNLKSRVEVTGDDEVATLGRSFNASAQRIETLVNQHKQLLAQASHELRTPLARLRMSAEIASLKVPEIADDLRTDIKELDELVGEILLASRLDAVSDLLQISSFDALALAAEESARTRAQLSGESVEVQADEALIRRALRNLLINADKYAPHGPVDLSVRLEPASPQTPEQVCFTVSDQGPGISPENRERVFESFFRAPGAASSGTGLGLSLVKQIALRHNGSVVCLPRDGGGCQFELRIPTTPIERKST